MTVKKYTLLSFDVSLFLLEKVILLLSRIWYDKMAGRTMEMVQE